VEEACRSILPDVLDGKVWSDEKETNQELAQAVTNKTMEKIKGKDVVLELLLLTSIRTWNGSVQGNHTDKYRRKPKPNHTGCYAVPLGSSGR